MNVRGEALRGIQSLHGIIIVSKDLEPTSTERTFSTWRSHARFSCDEYMYGGRS
jgi:hypothetical protein